MNENSTMGWTISKTNAPNSGLSSRKTLTTSNLVLFSISKKHLFILSDPHEQNSRAQSRAQFGHEREREAQPKNAGGCSK